MCLSLSLFLIVLGEEKQDGKPYKRLQSQGHLNKAYTVAASLMRIACLVVEVIHGNADFVAFADPLGPCIKFKLSHRNEHEHICHAYV